MKLRRKRTCPSFTGIVSVHSGPPVRPSGGIRCRLILPPVGGLTLRVSAVPHRDLPFIHRHRVGSFRAAGSAFRRHPVPPHPPSGRRPHPSSPCAVPHRDLPFIHRHRVGSFRAAGSAFRRHPVPPHPPSGRRPHPSSLRGTAQGLALHSPASCRFIPGRRFGLPAASGAASSSLRSAASPFKS